jgi:hypothetical protein
MTSSKTKIYQGKLPREFIETVQARDEAMLEFVIGYWEIRQARRWGLDFLLLLGQEDALTQMIECHVYLVGNSKWATFWLLTYEPKWSTHP